MAERMGVSPKTVQRYIKFMKEEWHLPISYDSSLKCYVYTETVSEFPGVKLDHSEVFSFLLAWRSLGQYEGSRLYDPLKGLYGKFLLHLGVHSSNALRLMEERVVFLPSGRKSVEYELIFQIAKACQNQNLISFEYSSPTSEPSPRKKILPLCLMFHDSRWYLVAQKTQEGQKRIYSLVRMQELKVHITKFEDPGFDIRDYMQHSFGVHRGRQQQKVKIWFDATAAPIVREREWNKTQSIQDRDEGAIEFSITVDHLTEIRSWILKWGSHAKVLEPKELVNSIQSELRAMLDGYEEEE